MLQVQEVSRYPETSINNGKRGKTSGSDAGLSLEPDSLAIMPAHLP